jgi:transcriptional regulator with XRE-family HTH domain
METLGSRLKQARKAAGYKSQGDLGKKIGVSHVTISGWERDEYKPDGENLFKLLAVLNISKGWLYEGLGTKHSKNNTLNLDLSDHMDLINALTAETGGNRDVIIKEIFSKGLSKITNRNQSEQEISSNLIPDTIKALPLATPRSKLILEKTRDVLLNRRRDLSEDEYKIIYNILDGLKQ